MPIKFNPFTGNFDIVGAPFVLTSEAVEDIVGAAIVGSSPIGVTYNDVGNQISVAFDFSTNNSWTGTNAFSDSVNLTSPAATTKTIFKISNAALGYDSLTASFNVVNDFSLVMKSNSANVLLVEKTDGTDVFKVDTDPNAQVLVYGPIRARDKVEIHYTANGYVEFYGDTNTTIGIERNNNGTAFGDFNFGTIRYDANVSHSFSIGAGPAAYVQTQVVARILSTGLVVGFDDTGYDVLMYGATSGKFAMWDESGDSFIIKGAARNAVKALDVFGRVRFVHTGSAVNSVYAMSLQSDLTYTYLEILNNTGLNKGVFFGVAGNRFELWNYQQVSGSGIDFYLGASANLELTFEENFITFRNGTVAQRGFIGWATNNQIDLGFNFGTPNIIASVISTGLQLTADKAMFFRDSGLKIYSSVDGTLNISSDGLIEAAATTSIELLLGSNSLIKGNSSGITINEDHQTGYDFIFHDGSAALVYFDAGWQTVGIGVAPSSSAWKLEVNGAIKGTIFRPTTGYEAVDGTKGSTASISGFFDSGGQELNLSFKNGLCTFAFVTT